MFWGSKRVLFQEALVWFLQDPENSIPQQRWRNCCNSEESCEFIIPIFNFTFSFVFVFWNRFSKSRKIVILSIHCVTTERLHCKCVTTVYTRLLLNETSNFTVVKICLLLLRNMTMTTPQTKVDKCTVFWPAMIDRMRIAVSPYKSIG